MTGIEVIMPHICWLL